MGQTLAQKGVRNRLSGRGGAPGLCLVDKRFLTPFRAICGCFLLVAVVLSSGCGRSGNTSAKPQTGTIAEQIAAAQRMSDPADRAGELIRIGLVQTQAKDMSGAAETLSKAARAASEVTDSRLRSAAFTRLAAAQSKAGERLAAGQSLEQAEAAAAKIEQATVRAAARVALADAQAALRSKTAAFATLQAVAAESLDSAARTTSRRGEPEFDADLALAGDVDILLVIAISYHQLGGDKESGQTIDAALATIETMQDARDRARSLAAAGKALAECGQNDRSQATFERSLAAARSIDTQWSKAYALAEIAAVLSEAGRRAKAAEVFAESEAAARRVPEVDLQRQALEEIDRRRGAMQPRPGS